MKSVRSPFGLQRSLLQRVADLGEQLDFGRAGRGGVLLVLVQNLVCLAHDQEDHEGEDDR